MTSNFIVDMKPQTLQKIITGYIAAFFLATILVGFGYYSNASAIYSTSTVLTAFGFLGYLFFLIALLKKEVSLKRKTVYIVLVVFLLLSTVSILFAADKMLAVYGNTGRYEGILAIIAYGGIFFAGSVLYGDKCRLLISDLIISVGIIQSVFGILQHIPSLENTIPSYYNRFRFVDAAFVANGLTGSPFFLGALLTIILTFAVTGAINDGSTIRRIIYAVASVIISAAAFLTYLIPSLIGISILIITVCIIETIRNKKSSSAKEEKLSENPFVRFGVIFALIAITFLALFFTHNIKLEDKAIIYQDGFYRLWITGPEGIKDSTPIYEHTWGEGIKLLKEYPMFGAGPDCVTTALYHGVEGASLSAGAVDRPYNEYLYIAMTRGIITLLAYLALLFLTVKKSIKSVKAFFIGEASWLSAAILGGIIAYSVQAFFNMSSITAAPFFWLILGLVWAEKAKEN